MTLKKKIFYDFSIFISLIIIVVGLVNCFQTFRLLRENLVASIRVSLALGMNSIDYYLQDTSTLCSSILVDTDFQKLLKENYGSDDFESKNKIRELMRLMTQYASTRSYITKVYFINAQGKPLDKDVDQAMADLILSLPLAEGGTLTVSPSHRATYIVGENQVFSVVTPFYENYKKENILGMIVADIDHRVMQKIITGFALPIDGSVILLSGSSETLMADTQEPLYDDKDANATAIEVPSGVSDWRLVAMISNFALLRSTFPQLLLSIFLIMLSILAVYVLSRRVVRYIYHPLTLLTASMKSVENGDFTRTIEYHESDEFSTVIQGYNAMAHRVGELINEVREKEELKRNAEIYALQAQISPHFLYNSLNSIRYFAKSYKATEIYDITVALIQLAQASLSSEKFISIHQEINLTQQYILIQKIRYGDIFEVDYDIDDHILEWQIPRFSIQPVVENALFHGILPQGEGTIKVSVKKAEGGVRISVADDGVGMPEDEVEAINGNLRQVGYIMSTGETVRKLKNIGLENINYRIRTYYHDRNGGVRVLTTEKGTLVEIVCPERMVQI